MADDPRPEAVAKAIVNAGFHPPFYVAAWSKIFTAAFDALRAFDQAQPQVDTAPALVMGADPFWLDEAAEIAYYAWMETKSGDYGWRNVVRAVLGFINAQPPGDAEIDAALAGWGESIRKHPSDVGQNAPNHMRAALIAAAKVRNGA